MLTAAVDGLRLTVLRRPVLRRQVAGAAHSGRFEAAHPQVDV